SNADGDEFADIANLVASQDQFRGMFEPAQGGGSSDRLDVGQITRREDGALVLIWNMHIANPAVRDRTSNKGDFAGVGNAEIGDVLAPPAQESVVLLAQNGNPDALAQHAQTLACDAQQQIGAGTPALRVTRPDATCACDGMTEDGACKRNQRGSS